MDRANRGLHGVSRRRFLQAGSASGIALALTRLSAAEEPGFAARETLPGQGQRNPAATGVGRIDGVAKVTGAKLYASDFRAVDMPGWPARTAHAMLLRAADATHVYLGLDLSRLAGQLQPSVVVTADDVARIGVRVPEFYAGDLFCPVGKTPLYLGQAVALLIFEDFDVFDQARLALRDEAFARFGAKADPVQLPNYGAYRFTRIGGPTPEAPDVYSPVKNGWVSPSKFQQSQHTEVPIWDRLPNASEHAYAEAADYGEQIRAELAANNPALLVLDREFETQSVDPMFLEPESGLGWYDAGRKTLELVVGVQSPYEAAESVAFLLGDAQAELQAGPHQYELRLLRRRLRRAGPHSVPALCGPGRDVLSRSPRSPGQQSLRSVSVRNQTARFQDAEPASGSIAQPARSSDSPPITPWTAAASPIFPGAWRPLRRLRRSASITPRKSTSRRLHSIRAASPRDRCAAMGPCRP